MLTVTLFGKENRMRKKLLAGGALAAAMTVVAITFGMTAAHSESAQFETAEVMAPQAGVTPPPW
jgi:hypothetical protein